MYQQESMEHMWEWNLKVLDRWDKGKNTKLDKAQLMDMMELPGCLAKTSELILTVGWYGSLNVEYADGLQK